jgi:hypothetical protein
MKYNGTFTIEEDHYTIWVDYSYYWDNGSWEQPPESDLEIEKVMYNDTDITDFYWDWVDDKMYGLIMEYAYENRPE